LTFTRFAAKGAPSQLTRHSGEALVASGNRPGGAVPDQKRHTAYRMQIEGQTRHVKAQFVEV
jgi:hypothetical protein